MEQSTYAYKAGAKIKIVLLLCIIMSLSTWLVHQCIVIICCMVTSIFCWSRSDKLLLISQGSAEVIPQFLSQAVLQRSETNCDYTKTLHIDWLIYLADTDTSGNWSERSAFDQRINFGRPLLVRAECVRFPWLLAEMKVATILGIVPSGVRALPLAAGRNEGGHYFR